MKTTTKTNEIKNTTVTKEELLKDAEFRRSMSDSFNSMMKMSADERAVAVELLTEWVEIMNNMKSEG